jgi:hypothetical protein
MKLVTDNIIALLQSCVDKPNFLIGNSIAAKLPISSVWELAHKNALKSGVLQAFAIAKAQVASATGERISNLTMTCKSTQGPPPPEHLRNLEEMEQSELLLLNRN